MVTVSEDHNPPPVRDLRDNWRGGRLICFSNLYRMAPKAKTPASSPKLIGKRRSRNTGSGFFVYFEVS
jgi:hypothetical protein